jgi:hypothetical protein
MTRSLGVPSSLEGISPYEHPSGREAAVSVAWDVRWLWALSLAAPAEGYGEEAPMSWAVLVV